MKLPDSVKVGPHTIPIASAPDTLDSFGQYTYDPPTIVIREGMDHTQTADTLLHEILHAIWRDSVLDQIMQVKDLDAREEALVRILATQIVQILRENPKVSQFLVK